ARWTPVEVTKLVDYLYEHCAEHADAGNFKDPTYNAATVHIKPHFNNVDAVKTGRMVAYKWGTVLIYQLKAIYNTIESYCSVKSGFHWDNKNGANIQGADVVDVWDRYENAAMRPFQDNRWEHYDKISEIFPSGGATGGMAFNATTSSVPSNATSESMASDMQTVSMATKTSTTTRNIVSPTTVFHCDCC
ncbi:hypothetical protein PAXRUDRAFT_148901, partial [Paxillus rubicundulus Ve08.2h10]